MPRVYLTSSEISEMPLGLSPQVQSTIAQLGTGVIDKLLARASQRCDQFTQKRLGAPITTQTIGGSVSAGATSVTVEGTLNLDNLAENALIIGTGGTQETVPIRAGGVQVLNWASPYPAVITLDAPLQYGHANNTSVRFVYREVAEAGSSSSSDPYTEALQTQAMQLALAHLPPARTALTRVIFLKSYPIVQLISIDHAFSFVNQFNPIDMSIESIVPAEGWYRMNVGTVILREGLMRTTYTAGYQSIPDDIKIACGYFFAEQVLQAVNPFGLVQLTMGKRTQKWNATRPKNLLVEQAEDILKKYRRII